MPNHITNYVSIEGSKEAIAKLKKATIKTDTENHENGIKFDFNGIIEMPKELLETVSPTKVVATQAEADEINKDYSKVFSPATPDQKIKAITEKEQQRRLKVYGDDNWYSWALNNWGTKWGAYEARIIHEDETHLVLEFQTAWSSPTPIFSKLESDWGVSVDCYWVDEDPSNEGVYGEPYDVFDINHTVEVEYMGVM